MLGNAPPKGSVIVVAPTTLEEDDPCFKLLFCALSIIEASVPLMCNDVPEDETGDVGTDGDEFPLSFTIKSVM